MENIKELEEMRRQLAILNRKIEKEAILNDKMMRRAIHSNRSKISRQYLAVILMCVLMIPYSVYIFHSIGLSVLFMIVTAAYFLVILGYSVYIRHNLHSQDMMNGDLLEVRLKVAKIMKQEHDWIYIGLPVAILWLIWYMYEFCSTIDKELVPYMLAAMVAVGVISMALGLMFRNKMLGTYKEIIQQINETTAEEP